MKNHLVTLLMLLIVGSLSAQPLTKHWVQFKDKKGTPFTADKPEAFLSKKAIERKTGARGLRSILEGILLDPMYDLPTVEAVEEIVINGDVVAGEGQPLYIYADRKDASSSA